MYSFTICTLLLTAAYGAPQDMPQQYAEEVPQEIMAPIEMAPEMPPVVPSEVPPMPEIMPMPEVPPMPEIMPLPDVPPMPQTQETPETIAEEPIDDATKNPIFELIQGKVLELSAHPLEQNTDILIAGKELSKVITAKIVAPALIFNGKVATAAAALPPLLAAKGAIIGKAIATPIEIGALASSGIITGVTGKLVAVPITLAAGAASKFMAAADRGEEVVSFNLEHGGEILTNGLIRVGQIILKPIAIVVGAQTAITGAGIGIVGSGIKGVGVGVEVVGAKMIATGLGAKVLGQRLISKSFPPYI